MSAPDTHAPLKLPPLPTDAAATVAILTRNGAEFLGRALKSVAEQETQRRVEVLAVDSGSTDGTQDLVREYGARVESIPAEDFNWGRTRNLAYELTDTPIVVNLSQDAIPAHALWLEHLVAPLSDDDVGASCGASKPDPDRAFGQFPWERNGYFYFTQEMRKFQERYGRGLSFSNSAVQRAAWEHLGLGEQPLGEDFLFQTKLHGAGLKVAFPEDAPALHHHNYPFGRLYLRCRNEGLALRELGCGYTELDLVHDLLSPRKYVQWLREVKRGSLKTMADWTYPALRPLAVYVGSRFARRHVWR